MERWFDIDLDHQFFVYNYNHIIVREEVMTTKPSENHKLNPQIAEIEIGTRNLRKIKIYPLAAGPQLHFIDKIGTIGTMLMEARDEQTIGNLLGLIRNEIPELISQIIPLGEKGEDVLNEMSVVQLEELVSLVYEMNFKGIAKNVKRLFGQILEGAEIVEGLVPRSKSQ